MTDATPERPRVLIVEDEAMVRVIAEEEFSDAGFEVRSARDGAEALDALTDGARFDLLFTDIRMPGGVDGWSVARAARAALPRIAVIYATGYSDEPASIVDGGVFLKKPYRFAAILETARRLGVHPAA